MATYNSIILHEQPVRDNKSRSLSTTYHILCNFLTIQRKSYSSTSDMQSTATCRNIGLYDITCNTWHATLPKCSESPKIPQCWTLRSRKLVIPKHFSSYENVKRKAKVTVKLSPCLIKNHTIDIWRCRGRF